MFSSFQPSPVFTSFYHDPQFGNQPVRSHGYREEDKVRDVVFKEEFISLPTVAINDDQELILDIVQEVNPEEDIVDPLPI